MERVSISETGQKLLWCPFAETWPKTMKTRGKYRKGYPEGVIVHFSAGRRGKGAIEYGRKMGFAYWHIDENGTISQTHPLNQWGYHAGISSWPGLGSGVSDKLLGIEIAAAGRLKKDSKTGRYVTWFGLTIPDDQVRHISEKKDNIQAGHYQAYTPEQEAALTSLILWLKANNPDVFNLDLVLGHDEVAPSRKNDPGGALSCSMPEFREQLKQAFDAPPTVS